jgi:cbb3-type cytochrome oxidase subunit 3
MEYVLTEQRLSIRLTSHAAEAQRYMAKMILTIAFLIFAVVFVASLFMPSGAGGLIPIYIILCITTLVASITITKKTRLLAVVLLIFSVGLTMFEYQNGSKNSYRERAKQTQLNLAK